MSDQFSFVFQDLQILNLATLYQNVNETVVLIHSDQIMVKFGQNLSKFGHVK